jgi:2-hydroxychromene-2-carboxylate isomerase
MPAKTIDYYFSLVSLWSYVGCRAFDEMARRHNVQVFYKPVDLMAVFAVSGGLPVKQRAPQRQAYRLVEMERWREVRKIPLVLHPKFYPANPALGHRMILAAIARNEEVGAFTRAGLQAAWAGELNIEDPATLADLASQSGLDGKALLAASDDPQIEAQAKALTDEAIARRVFGAPTYFYRDEPFWGQDRLDLLEAAITSDRPALPLPAEL